MTLDPPKTLPSAERTITSFMGGKRPKDGLLSSGKKQSSLLSFFSSPMTKRAADQPAVEQGTPSKKRGQDGGALVASSSFYEYCSESEGDGMNDAVVDASAMSELGCKDLELASFMFAEADSTGARTESFIPRRISPRANLSIVEGTDEDASEVPDARDAAGERYQWLVHIRDAEGRTVDDPAYDPRTLYIPKSAWGKFTPFEKQFWEIKCKLFDTMVFFKKGKFYELYESDADVGAREFDLKMVDRVNMRMVGVPEAAFEMWAARFVSAGYKIAKVDQTETSIGKSIREKDSEAKAEKIIRRELSCILTAGTLIEPAMIGTDSAPLCIALKEVVGEDVVNFGLAIVDASIGTFQLCDFSDDKSRYLLETILIRLDPKEVVLEKGRCSPETKKILKNLLPLVVQTEALPDKEFWSRSRIADEIDTHKYFSSAGWPETLSGAFGDNQLSFLAFGGLLWYLRELKLDATLLSAGKIRRMVLSDYASRMILDGHTLLNLDIIPSALRSGHSSIDVNKGTLLGVIDHCCTPFGRRLLHSWLCHPLRSVEEINMRLNFVDFFMNEPLLAESISAKLNLLPDLERSLNRIHCGSIKLKDYLQTLDAFDIVLQIKSLILNDSSSFGALGDIVHRIPDYGETLDYFANSFDRQVALREGTVTPFAGVSEEYDLAERRFAKVRSELDEYLAQQEKILGIRGAKYRDMGKEIFQLEISADVVVPKEYVLMSKTKTVKRYWTPQIRALVKEYQEWEERRLGILRTIYARMLGSFDEKAPLWRAAVERVGELDCLLSLYKASDSMRHPKCRPILTSSDSASFEAKDLRYPCLTEEREATFISNDISLGAGNGGDDDPRLILLTGPNMGGKSTLLRQTCLAVVMAQVGCYVPASECRLSPVDRIFTRLGANDNIVAGQSTFMVELLDTARILREAGPHSLVIIDELGRGTSTFDGMAIAQSTLLYLTRVNRSIGLFATHYRPLAVDCAAEPRVSCQYMSCALEPSSRKVTFLYKLVPGISPKSYGMNVAMMAGLPTEVIDEAEAVAEKFDHSSHSSGNQDSLDAAKRLVNTILLHLCSIVNHSTWDSTRA